MIIIEIIKLTTQQEPQQPMILDQIHKNEIKQDIMKSHRDNYHKFKNLVATRKFDRINIKDVNREKDLVIQHLNNSENQEMIEQFQELSFYQEKYLILSKFLALRAEKGENIEKSEVERVVYLFEEAFETHSSQVKEIKIKQTPSIEFKDASIDQKSEHNPMKINKDSIANLGVGSALFQFFENKQRQIKQVGFKDLIQKKTSLSTSNKPFTKKSIAPTHTVQIKKLLEENKRLHIQLEKRSKEDVELNQFQKNVLREQKERCMKRIEELEQQVEELARNNYKLQEIERSKKAVTTFINEDSVQNSKNQFLPYYIKPRPNDLQVITQNNKLSKIENVEKDKMLLQLVASIPPIEKKQQHSFDDDMDYNISKSPQPDTNFLGLLEDHDEKPKRQIFTNTNPKLKSNLNTNSEPSNLFKGGEEVRYTTSGYNNQKGFKPNDSSENLSRFDSFSIAQTAYNNSSLFMNASKNQVAIDSVTSTRNKVSFFKNSLVIYRDSDFQIAYKKSNLDSTLSEIRIILYVQNKTNVNLPVDIEYDYETIYYNFKITEKLKNVGPNQQGREVIEISLLHSCPDLNSVVDVHVNLGQRKLDLWLPICFIVWTYSSVVEAGEVGFMTIQPDRQFSTYEIMAKLLPVKEKVIRSNDEIQTFLFGRSRFGNHEVKLSWWQRQLTIEASSKILDFLGFVMHHFK